MGLGVSLTWVTSRFPWSVRQRWSPPWSGLSGRGGLAPFSSIWPTGGARS